MNKFGLIVLGTILLSIAFSNCPEDLSGIIPWPETAVNTVANSTGLCITGLTGTFYRICKEDSTWNDTITSTCPNPCPELNVNGTIYPETNPGNTTSVFCPIGFSGNITRECSIEGAWENPDDSSCTRNMCPSGNHEGIDWDETPSLTNRTYECPEGQTGIITRECLASGNWSTVVVNTCTAGGCGAETEGDLQWPATTAGSEASLSCPEGAQGTITRMCSAEGEWQHSVNHCVYSCPSETDGDGVFYESVVGNTTVTRSCPAGKTGQKTRYCNPNGVWDNPIGTCVELSCPAMQDYLLWPLTTAGTAYTNECPVGMKGSTTRVCNLQGNWEDPDPDCNGIFCEADGSVKPRSPAGYLIETSCGNGIEGKKYYYCKTDGSWSSVINQCRTSKCPTETIGSIIYPETNAGSTATVACGEGFSGSYTRVCTQAGTWQTPTNTCVPTKCPASIISLPSGNYTVPVSDVGRITQECASGYEGSVSFDCAASFTWSGDDEGCRRVKCSAMTIDGVDVPETDFNEPVVVPCNAGWEGSLNATCSATGNWEIGNHCERLTCESESVGEITWRTTGAGETDVHSCSEISATKVGELSRSCLITGDWGEVEGTCSDGIPATFTYEQSSIVTAKEQPVNVKPVLNGISYTSFTVKNNEFLPVGLSVQSDGTIIGNAYKIQSEKSFTIVAKNALGQSEASIRITVNNNVCEADGDWYAIYIGMSIKNKCSLPFGEEVRECVLNMKTMTAEWGSVNGKCSMIMVITIAVIVVVVLLIVLILVIVIRNSGSRVRYSPKKAQRKMIELVGV